MACYMLNLGMCQIYVVKEMLNKFLIIRQFALAMLNFVSSKSFGFFINLSLLLAPFTKTDHSTKYAALFTVIHERALVVKSAGDLYRVHKLIAWMSRSIEFQRLLYKNDLLRVTYNECLRFYHRIDFLDLNDEFNINQRKSGLYANLIKTCIQRFPDPASENYKQTVRANFTDFITLALK
jgi:hypothetical protein